MLTGSVKNETSPSWKNGWNIFPFLRDATSIVITDFCEWYSKESPIQQGPFHKWVPQNIYYDLSTDVSLIRKNGKLFAQVRGSSNLQEIDEKCFEAFKKATSPLELEHMVVRTRPIILPDNRVKFSSVYKSKLFPSERVSNENWIVAKANPLSSLIYLECVQEGVHWIYKVPEDERRKPIRIPAQKIQAEIQEVFASKLEFSPGDLPEEMRVQHHFFEPDKTRDAYVATKARDAAKKLYPAGFLIDDIPETSFHTPIQQSQNNSPSPKIKTLTNH